ncbi:MULTISPECIES: putative polysaccharide biosynthesis protein [Bhargavaea]|uniref:Oligosaccharide flippase family protein n=1 Tax=Bhargavaea changchunensis TaxID=2134037 RepID=A0ABW2NF30_9BACL|nr:polysaccharide biosynthesis protein [Bhargavaea sp. CC-171006]
MSTFFRGTIILMGAVFLSKFFGFIYRMQFMRVAGEEAVGTYMTAYPAFIFFLALIQLGLPIGVAKVVAELHAKGERNGLQQVMRTSVILSVAASVVLLPLLILGVPYLSGTLLGNPETSVVLYISMAALPIATASGLIRGYFQGIARIEETAWSQILEQTVRIALISFLLPIFADPSRPALTAGYAMAITGAAEVATLLYLYIKYRQVKRTKNEKPKGLYPLRPILSVSLPSSGSRLFGSFTWFLEPIVFIRALGMAGIGVTAATSLYGVISGVLIPLLLFPAFISHALSVVLVPAVSSAAALNDIRLLRERIHLSLRISAITGSVAAAVFFLHGEEMAVKLFHISDGGAYMLMLAPIFFFYYIQGPLHSILQAMQEAKAAMMNSVYGGIGKLLVMFVLASQPGLQEAGAVMAIGFGVLVTSFLHIATLRKKREASTGFTMFIIPYLTFILTVVARPLLIEEVPFGMLGDIVVTSAFLLVLLVLFRYFRLSDLRTVRKLAKRF